jgi:Tol biopolymer transport system component/acetyl esterase/lipase
LLAAAAALAGASLVSTTTAQEPQTKPEAKAKTKAARPSPTRADVPYGDHPRQVLDFYKAESTTPTPLVVFIHGGGWVNGDKSGVGSANVPRLLKEGVSVAAINYRFVTQAQEAGVKPPVKWPLEDAARAVQFLRSKADEWNLDKTRVGATGGSAGACSSLWLAFHDDLARPDSPDPVARESTRLTCAAVLGAQTSLDPKQLRLWMPNMRYGGHAFGFRKPGQTGRDAEFQAFYDHREEVLPWIREYSPYEHAGPGDPPVFLDYPAQDKPAVIGEDQRDPTHSAVMGLTLLEKLRESGDEAHLAYPGHKDPDYANCTEFLLAKLKPQAGEPAPTPAREPEPEGTVAFSSLAPRGWDVSVIDVESRAVRKLTDHPALDFNAAFDPSGGRVAFVSERDGNAEVYTVGLDGKGPTRLTRAFALDDRPAFSPDGRKVAFSSTREPADRPGQSWNAVYVMNADGTDPRRVSPPGAADYSPAWSPRGDLIACASGSGQAGGTDLVVMAPDGTGRRKVVVNGGWPCFAADGRSLFFHAKRGNRWSVWRVGLDARDGDHGRASEPEPERVTPADADAYCPSASADGRRLFVSVDRGGHRQIALIDLASRSVTDLTTDPADHWNPAVSPDGRLVAFHQATPDAASPNVEPWGAPPSTKLRLLRLAGAFPAFSPDGRKLALTGGSFARLDVMNADGTGRTTLHAGESRALFSISWAHHGDRIAFSKGPVFQGPGGKVEILTVRPDGSDLKEVTHDPANDGFPSFSPDGSKLVFRSGRGGSKNLYVMDADGSNVRRLTEGNWTDTMCDWSPTGDWITFASDLGGDFEVWVVRPDGTGLRRVVGGGGRNNHPHFSPDGRWLVFTSKRAGFSAEEITLPRQPQPYGDLFIVRADGTGLTRLTHNGFEEGTPAWGPPLDLKLSAEGKGVGEDY